MHRCFLEGIKENPSQNRLTEKECQILKCIKDAQHPVCINKWGAYKHCIYTGKNRRKSHGNIMSQSGERVLLTKKGLLEEIPPPAPNRLEKIEQSGVLRHSAPGHAALEMRGRWQGVNK